MKKTIYDRYDKGRLAGLPRVLFGGRVIVVDRVEDVDGAVGHLMSQSMLGLDTETRPSFKKGRNFLVSLLQVSTRDTCYLFRLNMIGMPPGIVRLLEDTIVPKVGLSLRDDILSLQRRQGFTPGRYIELQREVGEVGIKDLSLQKLYANLFGRKISKAVRLSNWENEVLEERQKLYAATDAWACIMIYDELRRLERTGDYELVATEPEPQAPAVEDGQD